MSCYPVFTCMHLIDSMFVVLTLLSLLLCYFTLFMMIDWNYKCLICLFQVWFSSLLNKQTWIIQTESLMFASSTTSHIFQVPLTNLAKDLKYCTHRKKNLLCTLWQGLWSLLASMRFQSQIWKSLFCANSNHTFSHLHRCSRQSAAVLVSHCSSWWRHCER